MEIQEQPREAGVPQPILQSVLGTNLGGRVQRNKVKTALLLFMLLVVVSIVPLPLSEVRQLKNSNPSWTAFMREHEAAARERGKRFYKSQQWISLSKIPKHVVDAIVVAEDGTFWSHSGFDWYEFRESVVRNLKEGRFARGASTITQQLVKNIYLSSSKNPFRKLREWILTWYMERTLSKSRILEIYLNVIEWGSGVYGIEAASQRYFGKSAASLTRDEATKLAAIIPSPRKHEADEDSQYVMRRASMILERMKVRGMVPIDTGVALSESLAIHIDSLALHLDSALFQTDSAAFQQDSSFTPADSGIGRKDSL
ncbi:MAG: monofunctional biosynthetic peptidoglycan transglycosylase [Ignavibacteriales bacterium]|nr:monofunctional biosynthetic peptidoglycan transglycosylase [Ignavibacteriales bacterium]